MTKGGTRGRGRDEEDTRKKASMSLFTTIGSSSRGRGFTLIYARSTHLEQALRACDTLPKDIKKLEN